MAEPDQSCVGIAQRDRSSDEALEHWREVARVGADQLENLAGGGLELQRLGQVGVAFLDLAEQPGVVDGDRRLVGERLEQ